MRKLDIRLKPAAVFIRLILLVLAGTFAIVLALPLHSWLKLFLLMLLAVYGWQSILKNALLLNANAILRLTYSHDYWEAHTSGEILPVKIRGDSTLTGFLSVLRFQVEGQRKKNQLRDFQSCCGNRYLSPFMRRRAHRLHRLKHCKACVVSRRKMRYYWHLYPVPC